MSTDSDIDFSSLPQVDQTAAALPGDPVGVDDF